MNRRNFLRQFITMAGAVLLSPVEALAKGVPGNKTVLDSDMIRWFELEGRDWAYFFRTLKSADEFTRLSASFEHIIGDTKVWNRALSVEEIIAEMEGQTPWGAVMIDTATEALTQEGTLAFYRNLATPTEEAKAKMEKFGMTV